MLTLSGILRKQGALFLDKTIKTIPLLLLFKESHLQVRDEAMNQTIRTPLPKEPTQVLRVEVLALDHLPREAHLLLEVLPAEVHLDEVHPVEDNNFITLII